jgi:hypothetical protein
LFQGSGRVSLHDNIFVDGPYTYPALVLGKQNYPLKVALVYNNTIYTSGKGIYFRTRAERYDAVIGNLVFGSAPISGPIMQQSDNVIDSLAKAFMYVRSPSFGLDSMDFYPLAGQCQGAAIHLADFHSDVAYALDFNGTSKVKGKGAVVYRGAYAGEGSNPGWGLRAGIKPPAPPVPFPAATLVWLNPASGTPGTTVQVTLTGANFTPGATLAVSDPGIEVSNMKVASTTEITAAFKIGPTVKSGASQVTVSTSSGKSNAAVFRTGTRRSKT